MIQKELVKQKLYEKYIEPTKRKREDYIGVEIEMPIINLKKQAVDFDIIHKFTKEFIDDFGFEIEELDDEGNIISAISPITKDILSYDCSYNNLELSFGREKDKDTIYARFEKYYKYIQDEFSKFNYTLSGMGVNPYRIYNQNKPIPNGRYRMLFNHLNSFKKYLDLPMHFHDYPNYGLFSSASQVQLDVDYDNLITTINAFSKLEPINALLFSNSVFLGENEDLLCCRDYFWENSMHGINPHNIGMFDCELKGIEDLQAYIESTSIYCVERDKKYINFKPINIIEYFAQEYVIGEYFDGEKYKEIKIIPRLEDINYLRTFKFEDLTFRGTIEFRSVCCQPIHDSMLVAAFHLGLMKQADKLNELLDNDNSIYHHGYNASELRKLLVKKELPYFVDEDKVYELAEEIVDLSKKGLIERGFGEEKYLEPLYERIRNRSNPGRKMLKLLENGSKIEDVINEYSKI
ncbi:glutamylcysteine synthetase [Eubacterium oxidoreducens]|uniref:Gamma-glutamylcysteine synthetase n=1 Tax=Eubacterium oxidoreducens TaxID=1732 RepID=A0A1G6A240_EUBOX|nr:glutamylcysteine synthetase [Eubacterium oxidoreducens]SDB02455.1 Gamma-glutamylcysteine synthetase [Eubacterium oxidoreducens]